MGSQPRMRMRAAHFVLAAICVAQMTFGEEQGDMVTVEDEERRGGHAQVSYGGKITGMALREDSTKLDNTELKACQDACTAETTCKSVSYRARDKTCLWSIDSLSYDPDFVMMTKAKTSATKKYRTFEGLTYRAKGWLKLDGKTKDECENEGTKSAKCNALSYRKRDMMCLLAPKAVSYAPDFNYYEKKGLTVDRMKLSKEGTEQGTPKKPKANATASKEDCNQVKALMGAEEQKLKSADAKIKKAKEMEAKDKQAVLDEKTKLAKDVATAKKAAELKLKNGEKKFTTQEERKEKEKEKTLRLEFASAELKERAQHEENKADREKKRTAAAQADVQAEAARKAARKVAEGTEEASERVEKAKLKEKMNAANQEAIDAKKKMLNAANSEASAKEKQEATKEKVQKKEQVALQNANMEKSKLKAGAATDQERAHKEVVKSKDAAMREGHEQLAALEKDKAARRASRVKKEKAESVAEAKKNKEIAKADAARLKKAEADREKGSKALLASQKQGFIEQKKQAAASALAKAAAEEQEVKLEGAVNKVKMELAKKRLKEQVEAKLKREA